MFFCGLLAPTLGVSPQAVGIQPFLWKETMPFSQAADNHFIKNRLDQKTY
jgi:hypothetical protein